jgi:PAS domain S-box-containing protein
MPEPSKQELSDRETARADRASAEAIARALKISEARYRRLFESARDGILILDSNFGRITDANPFMTELLGYSLDELIGKELWEIGLIQDKEASQEAFRKLKREKYIRYENLPLWNRLGEQRLVEFVSNLYRETDLTVVQCNIRDITDRRRVEAELAVAAAKSERIAATLQRSMLLESPAGKFPGFEVKEFYESAMNEAEVGGDFFDTFALTEELVALVVGDVSGKGLIAAGRTAEVKYALRAFLHRTHDPQVALVQLNDFICHNHRFDEDNGETFIVLALTVVNTTTGEAIFSAAGAEPSVILRASGASELVETTGWPLGIQSDAAYTPCNTVLDRGDTVVMATDGITEARRGRAFLGAEGMADLAEKVGPTASLKDLSAAIYKGALDFSGGKIRDDVCLLLARRLQSVDSYTIPPHENATIGTDASVTLRQESSR